jgi:hypothetical protein
MIVYRVEGPDGIGPYQRMGLGVFRDAELVDLSDDISDDHSWCPKHPSPVDDGIGDMADQEICGFIRPEDLKNWFSGWLQRLDKAGYVVAIYDVSDHDVRVGRHQVVFRPGTKISTKSLLMGVDTLGKVR